MSKVTTPADTTTLTGPKEMLDIIAEHGECMQLWRRVRRHDKCRGRVSHTSKGVTP
jgi:hypothetical protein